MENKQTATELLMSVADRMRQFGEGLDMIVIWTTSEGQCHVKANCNYTRALGLAHYGAAECIATMLGFEGGDVDEEGHVRPD